MSLLAWPLVLALGAAPVEPSNDQVEAWLQELRGAPAPNQTRIKARSVAPPKAKGDVREVYAKVAPGTVLIRTGRGFGTGIVLNARGYILTNHHVIAPAQVIDFKQQVTVELGKLDEDGLMAKEGKPRTAWVLKSDPLIDLAVIKLDDPPADLKPVKVAEKDPVPGEPVSAVGNGGIGLMWAIKDGEISSIGKLATHLALLVGSECQVSTDPAVA
ncbi:MAG: peptidase and chymotrypsin/Hap [Myxococcaceae bacterium]|nr:peptidase and chymotrypsin/Hap [Myxococcaceae bacterium]